ncbi:unnamed protein product [Lupinus luteus]|uniref:Tf2-1-like SH3-like domain-containing protein n=1 Tax=Lupinus luteus TaxID=3873 RepID=A0AAV1WT83_LUPLU
MLSSWPIFLNVVQHRFGLTQYEDIEGGFPKLSQTGSVADFQAQFEELLNKVTDISESLLISFFITGLKTHLRREFQFNRHTTSLEAFAMARAYEARLDDTLPMTKSWSHDTHIKPNFPSNPTQNKHDHTNQPHQTPSNTAYIVLPPLLPTPHSNIFVHNMPSTELWDHRPKDLCFKRDEKWNMSHKCRNCVLLLMEDDEDDPPQDSNDPYTIDVSGDISNLHSLSSQLQSRSLRAMGLYNNQNFTILIDNRSTHDFVKPALVERLGFLVHSCPRFKVATGCGTFLVCQFCCHGVPLLLQGINFEVNFFILDIEDPDVVLRFPWLQSLEKVAHDYVALTMEFLWKGHHVTLVGDTSMASQSVSLHQLQALVRTDEVTSMYAITASIQDSDIPLDSSFSFPPNIPGPVIDLLHQFQSVFATPTGLPPHRTVDHDVHIVEGSKHVNVRPSSWVTFLPWAKFHYNISYHSALQMSLFEALYGRKSPTIPAYTRGSTFIQVLDQTLISCDLVLERLRPYRQISGRQHKQHHLLKRFYGPYPIIERIGKVAYKLHLPTRSRIHSFFHISTLKPFRGTDKVVTCDLHLGYFDNQLIDQPDIILDRRTQLIHGQPHEQLLVQQIGCPPDEVSWEDKEQFQNSFPDLHLEDKVGFAGGENDTTHINYQHHSDNEASPAERTEINKKIGVMTQQ